jgi:hypothetical protein
MTEIESTITPDWDAVEGMDAHDEQVAERRNRAGGDYLPYLRLKKAGESIHVRYLCDIVKRPSLEHVQAMTTVANHPGVATRPKPEGWKGNWPKSMPAVCRQGKAFASSYPAGCPVHDAIDTNGERVRNQLRGFGLVIKVEEVFENGEFVGWKDATRTVKRKDGDKEIEVQVPDFMWVEGGSENFWAFAKVAASNASRRDPTLMTRVVTITREGQDMDNTKYPQVVNEQEQIFHPADAELDEDKRRIVDFDLRDPDIMAALYPDVPNLRAHIEEMCSDEYLNKFFLGGQDGPAARSGDASGTSLDALSKRITAAAEAEKTVAPTPEVTPAPVAAPQAPVAAAEPVAAAPAAPVPASVPADPQAALRARLSRSAAQATPAPRSR